MRKPLVKNIFSGQSTWFLFYLTYCFNCGWKRRFNMSCSIFFCWFSCSSTLSFTTPSAQLQALLNPSLGRYIWPLPNIDLDLTGRFILYHWIFKFLPEVCSNERNAVIFPEMTMDWIGEIEMALNYSDHDRSGLLVSSGNNLLIGFLQWIILLNDQPGLIWSIPTFGN